MLRRSPRRTAPIAAILALTTGVVLAQGAVDLAYAEGSPILLAHSAKHDHSHGHGHRHGHRHGHDGRFGRHHDHSHARKHADGYYTHRHSGHGRHRHPRGVSHGDAHAYGYTAPVKRAGHGARRGEHHGRTHREKHVDPNLLAKKKLLTLFGKLAVSKPH